MMRTGLALLAFIAGSALAQSFPAFAQSFPTKPIRRIVPLVPGIELMSNSLAEEFTRYVRSEADAFLKLVKEARIQVE